jgi:hypothetical protein
VDVNQTLNQRKRLGSYKPGPGRPKGSKNKATLALEAATRKAAASIDGAFEGDAHAFLQAVYRNPEVPLEIRIMAAGKALRVEKPALSAVDGKFHVDVDMGARLAAARLRVVEAARLVSGRDTSKNQDAPDAKAFLGEEPLLPSPGFGVSVTPLKGG